MRKPVANALLVLCSVLVFFLLLEAGLAFFYPSRIRIQPYHEKYDPNLGWVNRPLKSEGVHFEFARNRFFHVTHNSLGLRGPETSYKKPEHMKRVLFVGDSYFWGYGVSDEEVLTTVMQKRLPSGIEVLNGGTTGYGTDQMLLWLRHEGLKYSPDIVIFGFSAANDLDEISSSVSYYSPKPIFMIENGDFVLKNVPVPRTAETDRKTFGNPRTFFGKIKKFLRHNTHTYPFIAGRLNSRPEIRRMLIRAGLAEEYTTDLGSVPLLKNPPERLWELATSLISESRNLAEGSGARFVLVFIPEKETSPAGTDREKQERNTKFSSALREFTGREKMGYIDLLPSIRAEQNRGGVLYNQDPSDHHWNAAGHSFAAEEIRSFLEKQGWL